MKQDAVHAQCPYCKTTNHFMPLRKRLVLAARCDACDGAFNVHFADDGTFQITKQHQALQDLR